MTIDKLNNKIASASRWSAITEIMAKLISPIANMVLARLLTPEAFGIVATLTMVISFAEVFTDAGFQRYIIQHEFINEKDRDESINVAFWSNLIMSLVLWGIIAIFCEPIARLVGNPGLGGVLVVACVSIPLAAFSSIQIAIFKRNFDFKTLLWRRVAMIVVPLCVTIPLAFWLKNYWALVIGTIVTNVVNALLLTFKSPWKPRFYYSFRRLKEMFGFCGWMLIDSVLIWMTSYVDIFLVGTRLGEHYLGLFKTSMSTVNQFTAIITSAVIPVMLPALSRVQNDYSAMRKLLLKFQKYTSILLLPIGVGIYFYNELITTILLGNQWLEAASFIGIWALMDVCVVIFSRFCSIIYPAIGKPKYSVLAQCFYLAWFIPAVAISSKFDFSVFYHTRTYIRVVGPVFNMFLAYRLIQQSPIKMIKNIVPEIISCVIMACVAVGLRMINDSIVFQLVSIAICVLMYFLVLYCIPKERPVLLSVYKLTIGKIGGVTKGLINKTKKHVRIFI